MNLMKKKCMILNRLHIRLITIFFFLILSLSNGILMITPSDPLQYILPIYDNNIGFEFIDRITLFYFFKLYNFLNLPPFLIGSMAPLIIWIGIYILLDKILKFYNDDYNSQIILSFLFCNSVFILTLSQYIYPTIFLVFFELITFYLVFISKSHHKTYLIPIIFPFLLFSKIQSVGFIIFILILGYFKKKYTKKQIPILLLSLFIFITFFIYLNPDFIKINDYLFNQYKGRNSNLFPPFYAYFFEPMSLLIFISSIYVITSKIKKLFIPTYLTIYLFVFVLLIYIITQRGGPLVYNYNLEFFIFGLIPSTYFLSKKIKVISIKVISIIILISFIILFVTNVSPDNFMPAKYFYYLKINQFNSYIIISTITLISILLLLLNKKFKFLTIITLLLFSVDSMIKFKSDIVFKNNESTLIYDYLKNVNNNKKELNILINDLNDNNAHKYNMVYTANQFLTNIGKSDLKINFVKDSIILHEADQADLNKIINQLK